MKNLKKFFTPKTIAIVGASIHPGKVGYTLMEKLSNFQGKVIPINPKHQEVFGFPQQRMRGGRPYYYLYWYQYVDGRRVKHEIYLGKYLPKGMSFGKKVKIATAQNEKIVESKHE